MPSPFETRMEAAQPLPDDKAPFPAADHPVIQPVRRDIAGHTADSAPEPRVNNGCNPFTTQTHAAGAPRCARHVLSDPTSFAPIVLALFAGILIISGAPGKRIRPLPHRRGATRRARRWQRRVGIALIAVGLVSFALAFF